MEHFEHARPASHPAQSEASAREPRRWTSPGISTRKRWMTGIGVVLVSVVFFAIALSERAGMLVSTLIGIIFIGGFIGYLRVVAPTPFSMTVDDDAITRAEPGAAPVAIPWEGVAKVKEERFRNGKPVSITVYKRVGERGLHRAWVVYGDDIPDFAGLVAAVRAALPAGTPWVAETIHE